MPATSAPRRTRFRSFTIECCNSDGGGPLDRCEGLGVKAEDAVALALRDFELGAGDVIVREGPYLMAVVVDMGTFTRVVRFPERAGADLVEWDGWDVARVVRADGSVVPFPSAAARGIAHLRPIGTGGGSRSSTPRG